MSPVAPPFPEQTVRRTGLLERDHLVQAGRQAPLPRQHVSFPCLATTYALIVAA